jgi:hypothetical protein
MFLWRDFLISIGYIMSETCKQLNALIFSYSVNHTKMEVVCNILVTISVTIIRGGCDGKSALKNGTGYQEHIN